MAFQRFGDPVKQAETFSLEKAAAKPLNKLAEDKNETQDGRDTHDQDLQASK